MTDQDRVRDWTEGAGGGPDPESARTEAERLVAAGLAAVSMAADRVGAPTRERGGAAAASFDALGDMLFGPSNQRRHSVANDSPECCRCPVCRALSAARNPNPDFAERLASGVGFVAEGAARVLRGVADVAGTVRDAGAGTVRDAGGQGAGPAPAGPGFDPEADPWAAATAGPPPTAAAPVPVTAPAVPAMPPATDPETNSGGEPAGGGPAR